MTNSVIKLAAIFVAVIMMITSFNACARGSDHAKIYIGSGFENVVFRNGEGQYIEYVDDKEAGVEETKGDMTIYKSELADPSDLYEKEDSEMDYADYWLLEIPDSDYYSLEPRDEEEVIDGQIDFELRNKYHKSTNVTAEYVKKIEIDKSTIAITGDEGSTFEYGISQLLPHGDKEAYYNVYGQTTGKIIYQRADSGFILTGAKGKTSIDIVSTKNGGDLGGGYYYFYGQKVKIYKKKGKLIVSPSVKIPERETKRVTYLYLRPANNGKNMFLTWNKVKKAKSYIVYKYDYAKGKYEKAAVRNGANYLNINKAKADEKYRYKIVAKRKKNGKGKKVCKTSYSVWGVAQDNAYSNVTKVTTNRTTIKGKPGKKIRLKATVEGNADKKLLSKNIRWYCSNRKIAKVGRDTGKVTLMKKGKCKIWAKAHNGKNSEKIIVTVK